MEKLIDIIIVLSILHVIYRKFKRSKDASNEQQTRERSIPPMKSPTYKPVSVRKYPAKFPEFDPVYVKKSSRVQDITSVTTDSLFFNNEQLETDNTQQTALDEADNYEDYHSIAYTNQVEIDNNDLLIFREGLILSEILQLPLCKRRRIR
ncbi:MAG: hypothetical protein V1872_05400 [bacterium]